MVVRCLSAMVAVCVSCTVWVACGAAESPEPLIGRWQSDQRAECDAVGEYDDYDELWVDEDLRGELVLHFATWNYEFDEVECCYAEFDVDVRVRKKGRQYEIETRCLEEDALELECSDLYIELMCDMFGEDRMDCEVLGDIEGDLELVRR